ncbi:hypothetical protein KR215_002886, partial [Drosophila sulfurigaster]
VPERVTIVGFADDVALVVTAKHLGDAELLCSAAVATVKDWLATVGLQLADHKTEAVLICSRKIVEVAHINLGRTSIVSSRAIKYLGVLIDTRLSFREHLEYAGKRAAVVGQALSRIMINTRGPKQGRRLLLQNVVRDIK